MENETIAVILEAIREDIQDIKTSFADHLGRCDSRHAEGSRDLSGVQNGIYSQIDNIKKELAALETRTAVLQIKAGLWGAAGASVPSALTLLAVYIKFWGV